MPSIPSLLELVAAEFAHETRTTRKHLERLPDDRFQWQPHTKSSTAGDLASHLVDCVSCTHRICNEDGMDIGPEWSPFLASSSAELLSECDRVVAAGKQCLAEMSGAELGKTWRFSIMGKTRFERPKILVLRDFSSSHLIHHRGQFSVYLRLMDVPVPGTYGPSADERF